MSYGLILRHGSAEGGYNLYHSGGWTTGCTEEDGLVALWMLNETSGNPRVDAVGARSLAEKFGGVSAVAGVCGNAARFSGNWLYNDSLPDVNGGVSDFTVAFWLKPTFSSYYICSGDTGTEGAPPPAPHPVNYALYVAPGVRFQLMTNGQTASEIITGITPTTGQWQHVVIRRAGSVYTVFKNAVAGGSLTHTPVAPSDNHFILGGARTNGAYSSTSSGDMDELGFWNRSLSLDEIRWLYNSGTARCWPYCGT